MSLHSAAKSGNEATVRALLEHGASRDAGNSHGNVPQKLAMMFGKTGIAQVRCHTHTHTHTTHTQHTQQIQ